LKDDIHLAAYKSYGFNASHVGILNDARVRQIFYQTLSGLDQDKPGFVE